MYDTLRRNGYGAISDVNDKYYSSYKARDPLIVFADKKKTNVDDVRQLGTKEINRNYNIYNTRRVITEALGVIPSLITNDSYIMATKMKDVYESNKNSKDNVNALEQLEDIQEEMNA